MRRRRHGGATGVSRTAKVCLTLALLWAPLSARADLVETSTSTGVRETRIHLPGAVCRNPVGPCAERAIRDSMLLLGRLRECRVDLAAEKGQRAAEEQTRLKSAALCAPGPASAQEPRSSGWAWFGAGVGAGALAVALAFFFGR